MVMIPLHAWIEKTIWAGLLMWIMFLLYSLLEVLG